MHGGAGGVWDSFLGACLLAALPVGNRPNKYTLHTYQLPTSHPPSLRSALDRYLRRRGKRALRHVVKRLQGELLVLGLLSLMLVAFESYLLKICIPCGSSCSWDCPAQEAEAAGGTAAEGSSAGGQRRLQLAGAVAPALLGGSSGSSGWAGGSGRLLLAADKALDAYSCYQASETCRPGSEPFWSQLAIIQVRMCMYCREEKVAWTGAAAAAPCPLLEEANQLRRPAHSEDQLPSLPACSPPHAAPPDCSRTSSCSS